MLKNKIIIRKMRNIIFLLMVIAVMIGVYKYIDSSRAEEVVPISAIAIDSAGYLEEEEFTLEAKEIEEDKYEIELPEAINTKKVNQIVKVSLEDFENVEKVEKEEESSEKTETTKNANTATENVKEEAIVKIVENKIYLTGEEIDRKEINIEVEYDVVITEDTTLYNKILKYEDEENGKQVELKGYLPVDAELQVKELTAEEIAKAFGDRKMQVAYDIKILQKVVTTIPADEADPTAQPQEVIETIEINPEDFGEFCEVTIKDKEIKENSKVLHVKEDNTLEEVTVKETTDGNISFEAETFSTYGVMAANANDGIMTAASTSGAIEVVSMNLKEFHLRAYGIPESQPVQFAVWVGVGSDGSGASWLPGTYLGNNTWGAGVVTSYFNSNGPYCVHAYINGKYHEGGQIIGAIEGLYLTDDIIRPTASSWEIKNVTKDGYDVYVYGVSDSGSGVNRVSFPTWTAYNGQDDIIWGGGTNLGNGTWYFRVNASAHNNEEGVYHTHVYIYDNYGNAKSLNARFCIC